MLNPDVKASMFVHTSIVNKAEKNLIGRMNVWEVCAMHIGNDRYNSST